MVQLREQQTRRHERMKRREVDLITNPFDFSRETQEKLLMTRLASPEWQKIAREWFKRMDQIELDKSRTSDNWKKAEWSQDIAAREVLERLYDVFVLEEASEIIVHLMPSFAADMDKVISNIVLIESEQKLDSPSDYSYAPYEGKHLIYWQKARTNGVDSEGFLDRNHIQRVLFALHELLHAILVERYGIYLSSLVQNQKGTLTSVLHEAFALSLEAPVAQKILDESDQDDSMVQGLMEYGVERSESLEQINNEMWRKRGVGRKSLFERFSDLITLKKNKRFRRRESIILDIKKLNYREGVRIASSLQRRGWTVEEIPRLFKKIQELFQEKYGPDYQEKIATIPIDKAIGSEYQLLLSAITHLEP